MAIDPFFAAQSFRPATFTLARHVLPHERFAVPAVVRFLCALLSLSSSVVSAQTSTPAQPTTTTAPSKKLIEFGWDQPETAYLRAHAEEIQKRPFDGTVFTVRFVAADGAVGNFSNEVWGKRKFTDAELQPAMDDLRATKLTTFTDNFLRFNVMPGDIDWFDDFSAVTHNAQQAARLAREGHAAGILFDIEQYAQPLFNYSKQRDAAAKSFEVYAAQARLRGRELMDAFQSGYPDLRVMMTFGYCLPLSATSDGTPMAKTDYALLAALIDGMLDAARGNTRIIDGFENSYTYHDAEQFRVARETVMGPNALRVVGPKEKYHPFMTMGFGLWMDCDWRIKGWDTADPSKNFFTPQAFEASIRAALATADEYVWIYTETPKWWAGESAKSEHLPQAYEDAVRRARRK